jgi:hypothetical protein
MRDMVEKKISARVSSFRADPGAPCESECVLTSREASACLLNPRRINASSL